MTVLSNPSQRLLSAVAVTRHAERADAVWGHPWNISVDAARFSYDPPITAAGAEVAAQRAKELNLSGTSFDVVISSPYLRAVQTALVFAEHLGAIVILDHQLGEVLGPDVFGEEGPATLPWRTWGALMSALESCDEVPVNTLLLQREELLGEPPLWPESMKAARIRYASRYLTYLRRARRARMNCLLVTHGHMMQASLRVLPATSSLEVDSVGYCATMTARMYKRNMQVSGSSLAGSASAAIDGDVDAAGDGLAGLFDGGEWGKAEPLNDATLKEMTLCWWEASVNGVIYQGGEGNVCISSSAEEHPRFLAKLQQHLDWSWHHLEGLLGVLRPLQETVKRQVDGGLQESSLGQSLLHPPGVRLCPTAAMEDRIFSESAWGRIVSNSSDGGDLNRFVSEDSFCKLVTSPMSPLSRLTSPLSRQTSPLSRQGGFASPKLGIARSVSPLQMASASESPSLESASRSCPLMSIGISEPKKFAEHRCDLKLGGSRLAQRRKSRQDISTEPL